MQDILALFKRDAEYDQKHVDDDEDEGIFAKTRVLDDRGNSQEVGESTAERRKKGSLGFKKAEHSVYGRR